MNQPAKELAIPGFHDCIERYIRQRFGEPRSGRVLDAGAGQGAFSQRLRKLGFDVGACDLYASQFQIANVDFREANLAHHIPWDDETFDLLIALEVTEHIDGVQGFFQEVARVVKPGGYFLFSTPNILSLKSRIRFLLSGHFYSFPPLTHAVGNEISLHITPLTLDQYEFRLNSCGFSLIDIATDKIQRSSMGGMLIYPLIALNSLLDKKLRKNWRKQNSITTLLGRKLIVLAQKEESKVDRGEVSIKQMDSVKNGGGKIP